MSFDKTAYSKRACRQLIRRVAYSIRAYSRESLQQLTLQNLQFRIRAYKRKSFQQLTLQLCQKSLTVSLDRTALAMELESTALTLTSLKKKELDRCKIFKQDSSTRACDPQLDAYIGSTRASASQRVASTSFPRASRKQLRDRKVRNFPSLVRFIVNLLVHSLILHSLSFLFITSLTWNSLSLPSSLLNCWAHELSAQNELLTAFGSYKLMHNELTRTGGGEEIAKTLELANLLWDHELEELLTTKPFQLDQPQPQQQDQLEKQLWSIQLQQNFSENELDKEQRRRRTRRSFRPTRSSQRRTFRA